MAADERPTLAAPGPAAERLSADVAAALPALIELLDRPPADDAWLPRAACRGMDEAGFFPEGGGQQRRIKAVRAVCDRCPVRWECLADAIRWEPRYHRFGIWGGLSGRERALVELAVDEARGAAS